MRSQPRVRCSARGLVVASVLVLLAACSSGSGDSSTTTTTTPPEATAPSSVPPTEPVYEPADECPMPIGDEVEVEVTCGWLEVPENRQDPGSRTIRLAVARIHSRSADPRGDPVVQLQGGPGFSSLDSIDNFARSAILDERDYIIWDQRGLGHSEPNLDCPEVNEAVWNVFATTDDPAVEGARIEDGLRACRDRLVADGVDLDGYNTTQNAADLADLRLGLGIEEWNLRGISYGSALAIETVRNHPEGLRSVLLDSVVPPDADNSAVERGEGALASFEELYAACAEQMSCDQAYGDVEQVMVAAAAALDADPFRSSIPDPATGEERPIAIDGRDLYAGLFRAMYDESLIGLLPSVMQGIVDGERGIIDTMAANGIPFVADQHEAMTASVTCADRGRLLDPGPLEPFAAAHPELGALVHLTVPETGCPEWGVAQAAPEFNDLLGPEVEVPIIVMAGRFDPVTPVAGSRRVAEALGLELLLFPNAGHGAVGSSTCARDIWFEFLDDPASRPDVSCMADLEPPTFA